MTTRVDVALVSRGLFESRAKAQEAIAAGLVFVNGAVVKKVSAKIEDDAMIEASAPYPWVSRGGVKLSGALEAFGVSAVGKICLDVGASTGGFTHVLLDAGALRIYAVEVGHGQLHASLQKEPRVISLEYQDARLLDANLMPDAPELIVCDASFISLTKLLPPVLQRAAPQATLIALIKPQFEVARNENKKGIVRDPVLQKRVCGEIADMLRHEGWVPREIIASPILGGDGNKEFLICADRVALARTVLESVGHD